MKKSNIISFIAAMLMVCNAALADAPKPDISVFEHMFAPGEHYSFPLEQKLLPNHKYHAVCDIFFNAGPTSKPNLTVQLGTPIEEDKTALFGFSSQGGTTKMGRMIDPFNFTLDSPNQGATLTIPVLTSLNTSLDFINNSATESVTVACYIYSLN